MHLAEAPGRCSLRGVVRTRGLVVAFSVAGLLIASATASSTALARTTSGAAASTSTAGETRFGDASRISVPAGGEALGRVPSGRVVRLEVVLAPSHASALKELLHRLYEPGPPEYHHWLSKGSFARDFAPSPLTLSQVSSWLHRVGAVDLHRLPFAIKATVTAEDVASKLGSPLLRYRTRTGHVGYVPLQRPLVPAEVASRITAILGLNTLFRFEPSGLQSGRLRPAARSTGWTAPASTICPGAASLSSDYWTFPAEGQAYGMGALTGAGETASGETIALYELGSVSASDISTYWACFGLTNAMTEKTVDGGGGSDASFTTEVDADIEQAASQAPGASLISYEGPDTYAGAYDLWSQMSLMTPPRLSRQAGTSASRTRRTGARSAPTPRCLSRPRRRGRQSLSPPGPRVCGLLRRRRYLGGSGLPCVGSGGSGGRRNHAPRRRELGGRLERLSER